MSAHDFLYSAARTFDPTFLKVSQDTKEMIPVIAGLNSETALQTAFEAQKAGIAQPILVGKKDEYHSLCQRLSYQAHKCTLIEAENEQEIMKHALRSIHDGTANCLMKGHIHTDIFMKGIFNKSIGLRCSAQPIVHVFALIPPKGGTPLLISDAAVNPQPNFATQQESLKSSVALAHAMGIKRPKVAVLSATESQLETVPSSIRAAQLVAWANEQDFCADIEGPLALDGAIAPKAAEIKGLHTTVAGCADILLVPDLVSGNILFKSLVWFAGAYAAGLVLGTKVPVILTSRADPPEARLASLVLARLMSDYTCG